MNRTQFINQVNLRTERNNKCTKIKMQRKNILRVSMKPQL